MGGVFEARSLDERQCYDVHTKFHEDWYRHSELIGGGTARQCHKSTFMFLE
jgi:hypothetical protein